MTALPEPDPGSEPRLLTVGEYAALGETETGYTELQEGHVLMSPSPTLKHNRASFRLCTQLSAGLPGGLEATQDVDVDLELVVKDRPGFSRRPDLVVVDHAAFHRVDSEGGLLRASEVRLVVEIVHRGSRRMDNVIKVGEYGDAGIPYYWIVDLDPPVSLHVWHLAGEFGYQDSGTFTGQVDLMDPVKVRLDLDSLI
ncbi:MAG TPA: Uma2 family endonuclease [Pseudonocardiaceae bacterium]|nr:Uma2 family endonuclease [Pseudonocardiaceae bacterium]